MRRIGLAVALAAGQFLEPLAFPGRWPDAFQHLSCSAGALWSTNRPAFTSLAVWPSQATCGSTRWNLEKEIDSPMGLGTGW
jgi:hypothetical protein